MSANLKSLIALAFVASVAAAAWSQALPLVPSRVVIKPQREPANSEVWSIGPILVGLPNWSPGPEAVLKAPDGTAASFVLLEATEAARNGGYSAVADTARGPAVFARLVLRDECTDPNSLAIGALRTQPGTEAKVAKCSAEVKAGVVGIYAQLALYSPKYILQAHVVGSPEMVSAFLEAIQDARWGNEI